MLRSTTLSLFLLLGATMHSQNFKFGKVSKKEVSEEKHALEPDADAAVLYSYQRTFYEYNQNTGFRIITEFHQRIKIYTKDGFDWATKEISAKKGTIDEDVNRIKGITYNLVNGKVEETKLDRDNIFQEDASKYRKVTKFTMPAVKEGSVVEFEYQKVSDELSASMDRIPLQYTIPMNKLVVDVTIPEFLNFGAYNNPKAAFYVNVKQGSEPYNRTFTKSIRNSEYNGKVTTHQTRTSNIDYLQNTYMVDEENIPSMKVENHVDHIANYAAFLDWELKFTKFPNSGFQNYSQTWEGVSKSIYQDNGFQSELRRSNFYDDELDALLGTLSDPEEKARKIFNFVKQKVKWNDYIGFVTENGLKDAYEEGSGNTGDVNLLLVSMLKYARLDANPVLVSTTSNGVPLFPTKNGFNYLVASVQLDGKTILMDATDSYAAPGELPKRARNWQGRLIREDGTSEWVNLLPNYFSENSTRLNLEITDNGIKGKYINTIDGLHAKNFRMQHNSVKNAETSLAESLSGYQISNVEVADFERLGNGISRNYQFQTTNGREDIGDKVYFKPLLFNTTSENPFKADERTYPIYFNYPIKEHNLVNIMIPDGYEVVSLPESMIVKLKDNSGEFKYLVNQNGKYLRVDSEINISQTVFPADEYEIIQKFYNNIIEKQNESIVLKKISKDGLEERADSGR